MEGQNYNILLQDIRRIVARCREHAAVSLNYILTREHWEIGKRIVEEDQAGEARADYGSALLRGLSKTLSEELGKGFSLRSLADYRKFYLQNPDWEILHPWVQNLPWSHFKILLRVEDKTAREWYRNEAKMQNWSKRTLDRNVSTQYYYRLMASYKKEPVTEEMRQKSMHDLPLSPEQFIKSPMVTEFLGIAKDESYTESTLEKALITHIQQFIMELGKGYAFVERQQHIVTETEDYYIDLVFYNYLMKCFVLIDLKTGKLTHQDVGQMDMYVRMYDDLRRVEGDNPTVGILLCAETNADIARYSVLHGSKQLFASKLLHYLPDEDTLLREIDTQRAIYMLQHPEKS